MEEGCGTFSNKEVRNDASLLLLLLLLFAFEENLFCWCVWLCAISNNTAVMQAVSHTAKSKTIMQASKAWHQKRLSSSHLSQSTSQRRQLTVNTRDWR